MYRSRKLWTCVAENLIPLRLLIIFLSSMGIAISFIIASTLFHLTSRKPTGLPLLAVQHVLGGLFCLIWFVDIVMVPQNWISPEGSQMGINQAVCFAWYSHLPHALIGRSYFMNVTLFIIDRTLEVNRKFSLRFTMEDSRIRDYYALTTLFVLIISAARLLSVNVDKSGVCQCAPFAPTSAVFTTIYAEAYLWVGFSVFVCMFAMFLCCIIMIRWKVNHHDVMRVDDWTNMWPRRGLEEHDGHESHVSWMSPSMCVVPMVFSVLLTHSWDISQLFAMTTENGMYIFNGSIQQVGIMLQLLHHNLSGIIVIIYLPRVRKVIVTTVKKTVGTVRKRIRIGWMMEMTERIRFPFGVVASPKNSGT